MASIGVRKNGFLHFDFRYGGERCREYTRLKDSPANRKKMQRVIEKIEAEITLGTFEYEAYFPTSNKAKSRQKSLGQTPTPSFSAFCEEWFNENEVRWKTSYKKIIRGTLDNYLIPEFGALAINTVERPSILKFRADLARLTKYGDRLLSNDRVNHILTPC